MVYRVADLVGAPHLRVEVRAGGAGLDRPVAWAQTSDLEEPWSYLAGSETLMKNGQTLPESARGQTALITGLAEKGMCGMVIGLDAATPELTTAAITLADELRFPVMIVPYSIGFAAIGRAVADAGVDSGMVVATERVYNVIRQSVIHSAQSDVLSQLGRDCVLSPAVLDATTGGALDGSEPVPAELRRAVVEEIAARRGAVPGVLHGIPRADGHWWSRLPMRSRPCSSLTTSVAPQSIRCIYSISRRRWQSCSRNRTCDLSMNDALVPR